MALKLPYHPSDHLEPRTGMWPIDVETVGETDAFKSHGGERCGNVGTMIPAGTVERGERKRTVDEVSKAD
jgi:hypothetical protein